MKPKEIEHENTDEIVCPNCGYEYIDSWEFFEFGVEECPECNATYEYYENMSITYSTVLVEKK